MTKGYLLVPDGPTAIFTMWRIPFVFNSELELFHETLNELYPALCFTWEKAIFFFLDVLVQKLNSIFVTSMY